ncbi:MAG: EAL domain-containing protein [Pseudomonadota bacterium]
MPLLPNLQRPAAVPDALARQRGRWAKWAPRVLLALAAAALLVMAVLAVLRDRRETLAREQLHAEKVAEGVQLYAGEVIGHAVESLRGLELALAARADDEADRSATTLRGNASRLADASLALGLRSASGAWLVAGRDGEIAAGLAFSAALDERLQGPAPPGLQLLPAVFLPGLDWCVPIRLGADERPKLGGTVLVFVPVRRLVETAASLRLVAGGPLVFLTPDGVPLFRYAGETGLVEIDRTPLAPDVLARVRQSARGTVALARPGNGGDGRWTHLGFAVSSRLPLIVAVAVSAPAIEQSWLRPSPGLVLGLLVAALAGIVATGRLRSPRGDGVVHALSDPVVERATHDPLTGLLDRHAFQSLLQRAIDAPGARRLGVVSLDLNRVREVNESLGHAAGDAMLRAIAARLTRRFGGGAGGFIARLGGDKLALCIPLPAGDARLDALCTDICDTIAEPLPIGGVSLTMTASLGTAVHPDDAALPADLMRHAEIAMFEAKRELRPHQRYTPELDRFSADSLALRCEFAHALRVGGLSLVYQPKLATATGELVGVEALTRWKHPTRGFVSPAEFVPMAETTELIHPFTEFVLRTALAQCRAWREAGRGVPVAVNVSVNNLMDANFVALVRTLLAQHAVPPGMLELEVTESSLARHPELALTRLEELRRLGVGLSIDDFGTGYSSLAYLKRLPVDALKLDRSFTCQLATDEGDRRIVESTIRLGHGFGMKVVAEGVETAETAALLVRMGCDVSQGYFHARPMPADELARCWLAASRTA